MDRGDVLMQRIPLFPHGWALISLITLVTLAFAIRMVAQCELRLHSLGNCKPAAMISYELVQRVIRGIGLVLLSLALM